jgi:hypothetical protein
MKRTLEFFILEKRSFQFSEFSDLIEIAIVMFRKRLFVEKGISRR